MDSTQQLWVEEITRIDAKFMIDVAEERGLFTQAVPQAPRRKKPATADSPRRRRRQKTTGFEVERVAAPTYASLVRSKVFRSGSTQPSDSGPCICERHIRRHAAASAVTAAACTCDARHRISVRQRRPATAAAATSTQPHSPETPQPPCRHPFPLTVHELQLLVRSNTHQSFSPCVMQGSFFPSDKTRKSSE